MSRGAVLALGIWTAMSTGCGSDGKRDPTGPPTGNPPTAGTITGRVLAATGGAPVSGAAVTTQPSTSTVRTDAQGSFTLPNVAPGSYTVTASMTGFASASATATVAAGQTATVTISLPAAAAAFSYTQIATIPGPASGVASVAISPDGRWLAYGSYSDNLVHVVDVSTRQEVRTLGGHTRPVTALAFSADSRLLASTGTVNLPPAVDGSVRVWDVVTGVQLGSVATPGPRQLAFAPDRTTLAAPMNAEVNIPIYTLPALTLARTISGGFRFVAFSLDGARIATGARDDVLRVIDYAGGSTIATYAGQTGWVTAAAYSRNGQQLASAAEDRAIRIRSAATGDVLRSLTGHTSYPDFLEFSPDGTVLASVGSGVNVTRSGSQVSISLSSADQVLRLWNLSTGAELTRVNLGGDTASDVSFSADWRLLVTASGDPGRPIRIFQQQ